jgi:hypothetical protein
MLQQVITSILGTNRKMKGLNQETEDTRRNKCKLKIRVYSEKNENFKG